MNWENDWDDFAQEVEARLHKGELEYGNRSFSDDPLKLYEELREELRDVAGWAFTLDQRLANSAEMLRRSMWRVANETKSGWRG